MFQILANHTYQFLRPNFKMPKETRRNDVFKSVEILYECLQLRLKQTEGS